MSGQTLIKRLSQAEQTTAVTKRQTTTNDSSGFPKQTYTTNLTGLKVNVQLKSGSENMRYGRKQSDRFAKIYVEGADLDIQARDIITVTFKDGTTVNYNIATARERGFGGVLHMILECDELKGGLP